VRGVRYGRVAMIPTSAKNKAPPERTLDERDAGGRMSVPVQWRISIKMRSDVAALLSMPINVDRSSEKPPAAILTLRIETVIAPI